MENITALLCTLFALIKDRRITLQNLRRFVELPERLNDNWEAATVEEQLVEIASNPNMKGVFGNWAQHLRGEMGFFEKAKQAGKERFGLFLAYVAFQIGIRHQISVTQVRWFLGTGEENRSERERLAIFNVDTRVATELLAIARRGLRQERVSPYEMVILFDGYYNHVLEIFFRAAMVPCKLAEGRDFEAMSDADMERIATDYWQKFLDQAPALRQEQTKG